MTTVIKLLNSVINVASRPIKSLSRSQVVFVIAAIIAFESVMNTFIINKISYTEIDWIAYMQEVGYFLNGERNYTLMKGDTGPLVYPAGFLYIFSLLRHITDNGENIRLAQFIFMGLYLLNLGIVLVLYTISEANVPVWTLALLLLSKRIHSIYVLRMFNDCVALFLGYITVYCFTNRKWRIGSLIYSIAVSIKMNMLLYAPGILFIYLIGTGLQETAICLSICAVVQLILGYPFLSTFPVEYVLRSFDIGRVFLFKWTVNFRFLPEDIFVSKSLSLVLLMATAVGMLLLWRKLIAQSGRGADDREPRQFLGPHKLNKHFVIYTIFMSNFIGVAFARSLHYQFYCWYFHTLPYLLWSGTDLPVAGKVAIMVAIEVAFNIYPSTWWSSLMLQGAHLILLAALFVKQAPCFSAKPQFSLQVSTSGSNAAFNTPKWGNDGSITLTPSSTHGALKISTEDEDDEIETFNLIASTRDQLHTGTSKRDVLTPLPKHKHESSSVAQSRHDYLNKVMTNPKDIDPSMAWPKDSIKLSNAAKLKHNVPVRVPVNGGSK